MAALNIGMALSAAAGGFIVDRWGANVLAFAGAPVVIVALLIWLAVPSRENA
jgi:predicted MFS family arabinose efflux permease